MRSSRAAFTGQTILFGPGAAGARLREEIDAHGWRRAVVFRSPSAHLPAPDGVAVIAEFDHIRDHAPVEDTTAIARELKGREIDFLLALGGGKVSDTAKGVAALLAEGGRFEDLCYTFTPPDGYVSPDLPHTKLPLVAVPTTLAGAELSGGAGGTTADGSKRAMWDAKLRAAIAAYDPAILATTPVDILVTTGMNALHHCSEGLYSRTANPVSDAFAIEAASILGTNLRLLASGEREPSVYERLGEAAALAGLALSNARVAIGHAACHVLGARFHIPHGVANSIVLPASYRFNQPAAPKATARFTAALGAEPRDFVAAVGAPSRLRDHGVRREDLEELAKAIMSERGVYFNPRPVRGPEDAIELFELAW